MNGRPDRWIDSPDGTPIAIFRSGAGPPILLVHGAAADHTTWRVVAPMLARQFTVHAIDRRGRGASGDREPYSIVREYEDVAAAVETLAAETLEPVAVVGHSFGGRVALGAAMRTGRMRGVVCYEGAPAPAGSTFGRASLLAEVEALAAASENEALLEAFLRAVVGMSDADLAAYRANPVWPQRVLAAATIPRELRAEASPAAGLDAFDGMTVPLLLVLGGASLPRFHAAAEASRARLPAARVSVIEGARHAAHHTHPEQFVADVVAFFGEPVDRGPGVRCRERRPSNR